MIVNKITTGFVIQSFDTRKKRFVSQEFKAGDDCVYEDRKGNYVDPSVFQVNKNGDEVYLTYDMVQPDNTPKAPYAQYCIVEFHNCAPVIEILYSNKPITIEAAAAYFEKAEGFDANEDSITFVDDPHTRPITLK